MRGRQPRIPATLRAAAALELRRRQAERDRLEGRSGTVFMPVRGDRPVPPPEVVDGSATFSATPVLHRHRALREVLAQALQQRQAARGAR